MGVADHDASERLAVEQPVHDALRDALRGRRSRSPHELQQPHHFWRAEQYEFTGHLFCAVLNTLGRLMALLSSLTAALIDGLPAKRV